MFRFHPHRVIALALALAWTMACGSFESWPSLGMSSPYDAYARSLQPTAVASGATQPSIVNDWLAAGETAIEEPVALDLPFREALHFDPRQAQATAYELALDRGQELVARVAVPEGYGAPCFLDLFLISEAGEARRDSTRRVAQAKKDATELRFNVRRKGTYVLRLQPEMAADGLYDLEVINEASLVFPVAGSGAEDVGSTFGDPRSGGRRHDGVDIFAPRGTPAVAATDGRVSKVGSNRLGGKVVWLRGDGLSFYYAHLDSQEVSFGEAVTAGEIVGRVGNSGNAATTPPHLHFGIYDGGAVDPLPFLGSSRQPPPITVDLDWLGGWGRIQGKEVNLRRGPSTDTAVLDSLPRSTVVSLLGAHRGWYRAELPDGRRGYLFGSLLEPADKALRGLTIDEAGRSLRYRPQPEAAVVHALESGQRVEVLGSFEDYLLVRQGDARLGWITKTPPPAAPAVVVN